MHLETKTRYVRLYFISQAILTYFSILDYLPQRYTGLSTITFAQHSQFASRVASSLLVYLNETK